MPLMGRLPLAGGGISYFSRECGSVPCLFALWKTVGNGRDGIPFFQLTGREQYDNLSVDDISVTVITGDERRDATWERRR